jgi:hypothetical protein
MVWLAAYHAVVAAAIAPYRRSEQAMAAELLPAKLTADMLVLADRNFCGFKLWQAACATGAKLAWRVKSTQGLPVQQLLPDGSYLITVFDSDRSGSLRQQSRTLQSPRRQTQDEQLQRSTSRCFAQSKASTRTGVTYLNSIAARRDVAQPICVWLPCLVMPG